MVEKGTDQEEIEEQVAIFRALADPTRLKLVYLLSHQCAHGALCVNALAGALGITQSAVSQHLRILKSVGLVRGERQGCHIHYGINHQALEHCHEIVLAALMKEKLPHTG